LKTLNIKNVLPAALERRRKTTTTERNQPNKAHKSKRARAHEPSEEKKSIARVREEKTHTRARVYLSLYTRCLFSLSLLFFSLFFLSLSL
jgi:hypothetical protein